MYMMIDIGLMLLSPVNKNCLYRSSHNVYVMCKMYVQHVYRVEDIWRGYYV